MTGVESSTRSDRRSDSDGKAMNRKRRSVAAAAKS